MHRRAFAAGSLAVAAVALRAVQARPAEPPVVFAAASLTDVFKSLGVQWAARTGADPRFAFAASSTLARQIGQGAPADIFASADEAWMDVLQRQGLIVDATRTSPIGNTLVLIAPAGAGRPLLPSRPSSPRPSSPRPPLLSRDTDLAGLLGPDGRLATGDPAHVPAGIYARQALTWMGQWDAIGPRIARADSVRAALLLVQRGEAPLGIVYATDVGAAQGVVVAGVFPPESHPPVRYPFALLRRAADDAGARALLAFLTGPDAACTYRRLGFSVTPE